MNVIIQVLKEKKVIESEGGTYTYTKANMIGDALDIHLGSDLSLDEDGFDFF